MPEKNGGFSYWIYLLDISGQEENRSPRFVIHSCIRRPELTSWGVLRGGIDDLLIFPASGGKT